MGGRITLEAMVDFVGPRTSAAILVGGKSRRMGYNKAFLKIGRHTLVEKVAARLKAVFPELFLVGSNPAPYFFLGLPFVKDIYPGCGPLVGIHAALTAATNHFVFVTACDLPFLDLGLVATIVAAAPGYDVVVPRIGEYLEPLCAVYGKGCLPVIETSFRSGQYKIAAIFPEVRVRYLEEGELRGFNLAKAFFNLNTPKDLQRVEKLFAAANQPGKGCWDE